MTARKVSPAVGRLVRSLELGPDGDVLAAQARHLAGLIDAGALPPYAVAGAHRELRAIVEAMREREQEPEAGITDAELEALLDGTG